MQPTFTLSGIAIDYHDALVVAGFWAALFDVELRESLPGWRRLGPLTAGGPSLTFQPVRDPTQGKVRLHLDLQVDDDLSDQGCTSTTKDRGRSRRRGGQRVLPSPADRRRQSLIVGGPPWEASR